MECTKAKFSDEKQAQYYIDKLKNTSIREKKPIRAYLCPHCLSWHLTSKTEKDDLQMGKYRQEIKNKNALITQMNERIRELKEKVRELKGGWRQTNKN